MSVPPLDALRAWVPRLHAVPALMLCAALGCASTTGTGNAARPSDVQTGSVASPPNGDVLDPLQPGEQPEESPPTVNPSGLRGELTKGTTYYESHPDEFYQRMLPLGWHGRSRKRKCRDTDGTTQCNDNKKKGMLVIQAIHDANKVKVDVQSAYPVVVGRVINTGGVPDALLPAEPARPGFPPDQYYFIVERGTPTQAKLMVAQVQLSADARTATAMTIHVAPMGFVKCVHPDSIPPRTQGSADFRSCTGRHGPDDDSRSSDEHGPRWIFDTALDMAWFSCDGGCCSAQWPP